MTSASDADFLDDSRVGTVPISHPVPSRWGKTSKSTRPAPFPLGRSVRDEPRGHGSFPTLHPSHRRTNGRPGDLAEPIEQSRDTLPLADTMDAQRLGQGATKLGTRRSFPGRATGDTFASGRPSLRHDRDELVATPVNGADRTGLPRRLVERRPELVDESGKRPRPHARMSPDHADQLFARHHPFAVRDQVGEEIERLRSQGQRSGIARQSIGLGVQLESEEADRHAGHE